MTWSHYLALLSVDDSKKRKKLETNAIKEKWSRRRLKLEIKKLNVKGARKEKPVAKLTPRLGKPGVYAVTEWPGTQTSADKNGKQTFAKTQGEKKRAYDLGFSSFKTIRSKPKRKPKPFDLFTYYADVERVIDGDTLWVQIDCGFSFGTRQKFRPFSG